MVIFSWRKKGTDRTHREMFLLTAESSVRAELDSSGSLKEIQLEVHACEVITVHIADHETETPQYEIRSA